jgi:hypothetical protein
MTPSESTVVTVTKLVAVTQPSSRCEPKMRNSSTGSGFGRLTTQITRNEQVTQPSVKMVAEFSGASAG